MPLDSPDLTELTTVSQAIVSYEFTDIEDGTGVSTYFGFADDNTGATSYGLTKQNIYSKPEATAQSSAGGTETKVVDFDLVMNVPKTVNGDLVANIPITAVSNQDLGCRTSVTLNVIHYDGSTETSLGTKTSNYITNNGANILKDGITCLIIPVDNRLFAAGEILRMKVTLTVTRLNGIATGSIRHDPQNRSPASPSVTYQASNMIFNVPFKLEI